MVSIKLDMYLKYFDACTSWGD